MIPYIRRGPNYCFFESAVTGPNLQKLSSYDASGDRRYFILLGVLDYGSLVKPIGSGETTAPLSEEDIAATQAGRAVLLLDHSNEGPIFSQVHFTRLLDQLDQKRIPARAVVYICQNRRMESAFRQCFPGSELQFWSIDYFPKVIMTKLHNLGSSVGSALHRYEPFATTPDRLFNCLNAAPRWNRILVYRWLQEHGCIEDGLVSFHGIGRSNPKSGEIDISSPPPGVGERFGSLVRDLATHLPHEPVRFDASETVGNPLSQDILVEAYARSCLTIVTESDFFEDNLERITEKSVKSAAMGIPFIIVGPPGSVAFTRALGFHAFDDLIDHGYDLVEDPIARLTKVFAAIDATLARIRRDRHGWIEAATPKAKENWHWSTTGLSGRYDATCIAPVLHAMTRFVETGQW